MILDECLFQKTIIKDKWKLYINHKEIGQAFTRNFLLFPLFIQILRKW